MNDNERDLQIIAELQKTIDELKKKADELPKRRLEKPDFGDFVQCESCSSWEQCSPCDMCVEEGYAAVGKNGETIILKKYKEGGGRMNTQLMSPSDILEMMGQRRWFHSIALRAKEDQDYVLTHKFEREPQSNYRLRDTPVQLTTTITKFNGDGTIAEIQEMTTEEASKILMRIRGPRKQGAARAVKPTHVKVIKTTPPVPAAVGIAIYEGRTEQEIQIAMLESQIKELMGLAPKPVDVSRLVKKMEERRIK